MGEGGKVCLWVSTENPIMIICVGNSAPSLCFSPIRKEFLTQFRCVYWCSWLCYLKNLFDFFILTHLVQIYVTILCWFKSEFEFLLQSMFELLAKMLFQFLAYLKIIFELLVQNPFWILVLIKTLPQFQVCSKPVWIYVWLKTLFANWLKTLTFYGFKIFYMHFSSFLELLRFLLWFFSLNFFGW